MITLEVRTRNKNLKKINTQNKNLQNKILSIKTTLTKIVPTKIAQTKIVQTNNPLNKNIFKDILYVRKKCVAHVVRVVLVALR